MIDKRFTDRLKRSGPCLLWQGALHSNGYGATYFGGKQWRTHRYAWFLANGPIPPGVMVLHLCRNRNCVAVEHLYLGDAVQNERDKRRDRSGLAASTHCKYGHELTPANAPTNDSGHRRCRECARRRISETYLRRRFVSTAWGIIAHFQSRAA